MDDSSPREILVSDVAVLILFYTITPIYYLFPLFHPSQAYFQGQCRGQPSSVGNQCAPAKSGTRERSQSVLERSQNPYISSSPWSLLEQEVLNGIFLPKLLKFLPLPLSETKPSIVAYLI